LPSLAKVEPLKVEEKPSCDEERPPKVELKTLPSSLRYVPNSTYTVIVNSSLSATQVESLLRVLRERYKAKGYTLEDLKGIHPSI